MPLDLRGAQQDSTYKIDAYYYNMTTMCMLYIYIWYIWRMCIYIYNYIYIHNIYKYIMYLYMVCMCVFTGSVSSHQIIDLYIQLRSIRNPQLGHRKASEWGCYHHFRCPFWMFKAVLSRFWKTRCTVDQSNPINFGWLNPCQINDIPMNWNLEISHHRKPHEF
jgi:hypothetical protein